MKERESSLTCVGADERLRHEVAYLTVIPVETEISPTVLPVVSYQTCVMVGDNPGHGVRELLGQCSLIP
jgi:hypothetical protein